MIRCGKDKQTDTLVKSSFDIWENWSKESKQFANGLTSCRTKAWVHVFNAQFSMFSTIFCLSTSTCYIVLSKTLLPHLLLRWLHPAPCRLLGIMADSLSLLPEHQCRFIQVMIATSSIMLMPFMEQCQLPDCFLRTWPSLSAVLLQTTSYLPYIFMHTYTHTYTTLLPPNDPNLQVTLDSTDSCSHFPILDPLWSDSPHLFPLFIDKL